MKKPNIEISKKELESDLEWQFKMNILARSGFAILSIVSKSVPNHSLYKKNTIERRLKLTN